MTTTTLSDVLQPLVERELRDAWVKADDLGSDDLESRAHDLVHIIVAKVREQLGFEDNAIVWEEGGHSSQYGYVGKVRLFSVSRALSSEDRNKPWILGTTLPQLTNGSYASIEEAKDAARVKLRDYLGHLAQYGARASFA